MLTFALTIAAGFLGGGLLATWACLRRQRELEQRVERLRLGVARLRAGEPWDDDEDEEDPEKEDPEEDDAEEEDEDAAHAAEPVPAACGVCGTPRAEGCGGGRCALHCRFFCRGACVPSASRKSPPGAPGRGHLCHDRGCPGVRTRRRHGCHDLDCRGYPEGRGCVCPVCLMPPGVPCAVPHAPPSA